MHCHAVFGRAIRNLIPAILLGVSASPIFGGEINITQTNLVDRWITNLIEVRMPANHFVNEYHTNWITQMRTNIVYIYATNIVSRTLTNRVMVDLFQTNIVTSYRTNLQDINLTNWQPVVVIKTNWTTQPVTTVVEVTPRATAPSATETHTVETAAVKSAGTESAVPTAGSSLTIDGLVIEVSRQARPAANGQIDVTLKARNVGEAGTPVQVQQWRVEREDGAVLVFGQEQEFKRELPVGRYKLEIKIQHDNETPLVTARAILSVTAQEATLQQRLTAKR
jgi:hypothetical protein